MNSHLYFQNPILHDKYLDYRGRKIKSVTIHYLHLDEIMRLVHESGDVLGACNDWRAFVLQS